MDKGMKKRWISLYVENQVGVLSKISGLFSGKCYNLDSLTVGTTEDPTVSRMTIATVSDDETFEQIKKQLNRMIEVIKVIDFTDVFVRMKEILYIKVFNCSKEDKAEPVSYTHLDVYKRQALANTQLRNLFVLCAFAGVVYILVPGNLRCSEKSHCLSAASLRFF